MSFKLKAICAYKRLERELKSQKAMLAPIRDNRGEGKEIGSVITKSAVTFAVGLLIVSAIWGALELQSGDAFYNISTNLEGTIGTAFKIGILGVVVLGAGFIMHQLDWF